MSELQFHFSKLLFEEEQDPFIAFEDRMCEMNLLNASGLDFKFDEPNFRSIDEFNQDMILEKHFATTPSNNHIQKDLKIEFYTDSSTKAKTFQAVSKESFDELLQKEDWDESKTLHLREDSLVLEDSSINKDSDSAQESKEEEITKLANRNKPRITGQRPNLRRKKTSGYDRWGKQQDILLFREAKELWLKLNFVQEEFWMASSTTSMAKKILTKLKQKTGWKGSIQMMWNRGNSLFLNPTLSIRDKKLIKRLLRLRKLSDNEIDYEIIFENMPGKSRNEIVELIESELLKLKDKKK